MSRQPAAGGTPALWRRADLLAPLSYAALAIYVMCRLWADPAGRVLRSNQDDHGIFLFMIAHGERVVFHGESLLRETHLNYPVGVNMMANTSMLLASLPLAPITHFFGAGVTVVLLLTLGLFGSAYAWYWVLSRHLVKSRTAAWIGGLWGGFAPAWISHASGHVNFVSGYLIPFIVLQVLRLREPGRVWRGGIILGVLAVAQVFLNEESLLFTALAMGLFVMAYAVMRPRESLSYAPRMIAGGTIAALVALIPLAYPLLVQFKGAGHYHGQPFEPDTLTTTVNSLFAYPRNAIAGTIATAKKLSGSPTEDNTFYGPAGLLMILVSMGVLWRSAAARAAALAALVLLFMSFGSHVRFTTAETDIPLPFAWVSTFPVLDLVTVPRYALAPTVIFGVLLALAADKAFRARPKWRRLFVAGLVLALVPLFPKPVPTKDAPPVPKFFSQKLWLPYAEGGRSIVPVPLPGVTYGRDGQRVAALSNLAFPVPRGYFMGPADPPGNDQGAWGAPPRYTSQMLQWAQLHGESPVPGAAVTGSIQADLRYWKAGAVVLLPSAPNKDVLEHILTDALGSPQLIGGVEVWDVRSIG